MYLNDKSFQALIFSLVIHGIFVLIMRLNGDYHWTPSQNETTEVTIIEETKKHKSIVTQADLKPKEEDLLKKFKDQADFLAQFTQRVKEQLKARRSGETRNSNGRGEPNESKAQKMAGMQGRESKEIGETRPRHNQNFTRNIVMGESSLSERIPGVKEGAFTSLNTDQFTYYTFFARINEQIRYRWVRQIRNYLSSLSQQDMQKLSKQDRVTRVEIVLSPKGEVVNALVHFTSGYKALDQATTEAFISAAPFLNPPQGLVEQDGNIHLYYEFYLTLNPSPFVGPENN